MKKKLALLFHTLRYLKPIQLYWRFYLKVNQKLAFSTVIKQPLCVGAIDFVPPIAKHASHENAQFCFLNEYGSAAFPVDWNNDKASKLWLYNLHYFDYLNQSIIDQSVALDLIQDWIKCNPVGQGNGWEPYTLSLRIVNWVKFLSQFSLKDEQLSPVYESLFLQSRFLYKHLEYHLLGNHLFKNGVALMFAGNFFDSKEAQCWLTKGRQIILSQTKEQVLEDGGHFERSPMYHVLILEDILDCLNLDRAKPCLSSSDSAYLTEKASAMLGFLTDILHPDNEIPFFNDSALNIAPRPEAICDYADRLRIPYSRAVADSRLIEKPSFGLLVLQNQLSKMMFDVGCIGPDYLPGHAHCDTLSYELSLAGKRCIVNSGTYQYAGSERNKFRATKAHNTVQIDGVEQHEIWSTFRVARRAYPLNISVDKDNSEEIKCSASVSSFKQLIGNPVHRRNVSYQKEQIIISDVIEGEGEHVAESYIHLHPDVNILNQSNDVLQCKLGETVFSIQALDTLKIHTESAWFSAEFGLKTESTVVVLRKQAMSPFSFGYSIIF